MTLGGYCPSWSLRPTLHVAIQTDSSGSSACCEKPQGMSRLVYVTVGTGIGGGIILDGQLYRGADMAHPEIGHHVIDPSGPLCSCGFRGCWESLATGPAMIAWLRTHVAPDHCYPVDLTAEQVCELAKKGDVLARQAVEREAYYLG